MNQNSTNNHQLFNTNNQVAWVADVPGSKDKYVALFNTAPAQSPRRGIATDNSGGTNAAASDTSLLPANISVSLADVGLGGKAKVRDLWTHKDLGTADGTFTATINSHGAGLYRFSPGE